jgi:hypothetical protein
MIRLASLRLLACLVVGAALLSGCVPQQGAEDPSASDKIEGLVVHDGSLVRCGLAEGEARDVNAFVTFDAAQKVSRVRVEPASPSRPELVPSPDLCRCLEAELARSHVSKGHFPPGVEMRKRIIVARSGPSSLPPFDRGAAAAAIASVKPQACKSPDGPTGVGHFTVTFAPSGKVALAELDETSLTLGAPGPVFAGTPAGKCITDALERISIPPFSDTPVRVGKAFRID